MNLRNELDQMLIGKYPDFGYGELLIGQDIVGGWQLMYEALKGETKYQIASNSLNSLKASKE